MDSTLLLFALFGVSCADPMACDPHVLLHSCGRRVSTSLPAVPTGKAS